MNILDYIVQIDFAILNFIQEFFRCTFLDFLMPFFSNLGKGGIIWFAITIPMLFFKKTRSWGIMGIVAMAVVFISGELILKNIVCRERPFYSTDNPNLPVVFASGFSFPSSHSSSSFAVATVLFKMNKKIGVAALVLAAIIAFSRLYNYVHFPSDVICGTLLGIFGALFVCFMFKKFGWKDKIDRIGQRGDKGEST